MNRNRFVQTEKNEAKKKNFERHWSGAQLKVGIDVVACKWELWNIVAVRLYLLWVVAKYGFVFMKQTTKESYVDTPPFSYILEAASCIYVASNLA